MGVPVWCTRVVCQLLVRCQHLDHPQPCGRPLVDVVSDLAAQLRLIGAQIAEQDAGLSLTHI